MFDLEDAKKRGCLCGGKPTRIIAHDIRGTSPIVAAINRGGYEAVELFDLDGSGLGDNLANLPREVTVWAVRNEAGIGGLQEYEADAKTWCARCRLDNCAAGYAPVTIKLTR